ncbi:MAG: branched-chain amino acid ABC transporter permease [Alphaproteobacteria bacterium]|nr:branched-chain amino acid ABC transporter permease [Alphaproteobacteria bacterium]
MSFELLLVQILNGFQLGVLLFLVAAGFTLIFGIMGFLNLAHGSFYMIGAFICSSFTLLSGSFFVGIFLTLPVMALLGAAFELLFARHLYERDHLDQALATFGIMLVFNALVQIIWGVQGVQISLPDYLRIGMDLPVLRGFSFYRLIIILVGVFVASFLYFLVHRTHFGMLIRACSSDRMMLASLGVNVQRFLTVVFALGAVLSGFSGMMVLPLSGGFVGMGREIMILSFIVVIMGGAGSVKGAFWAALLIGFIDTMGRAFVDDLLKFLVTSQISETVAPAVTSILIYLFMFVILFFMPRGLFPLKTR